MVNHYKSVTLDEDDLEFQIETIISFLSLVHPYLIEDEVSKACVEIRPVLREKKEKQFLRSCVLWDLKQESINKLETFLKKINGNPACLFYSVYSFDNNKKVLTSSGYKKGRILGKNAIFTCEIVLDFDGLNEEKRQYYNDKLHAVGIFPLWVFTGHGFQAHILLDEKLYELDALEKFVYLFISKGFPVDESCKDAARLMRIPFTYNCKGFSYSQHSERETPYFCEVIQHSDIRHNVSELIYKLSLLPTLCPDAEKTYLNLKNDIKISDIEKEEIIIDDEQPINFNHDEICIIKNEYPYIDRYDIPVPISKMLSYTPEGYRNKVLAFLIRYFKINLKMAKKQAFEILSIWGVKACDPQLNKYELEKDFNRLFHIYGGLPYDSELAKKFGFIEFNNDIVISKKEIAISNAFFADFDVLSGKLIRMYLAIRLLEHVNKNVTQSELAKLLKISDRAVRSTLKELLKTKHCYVTKGNAKLKIENTYHSNRLYQDVYGYSIFSYNDIKCYIVELFEDKKRGNNELKLYLYMQYRFKNNEIFMSQTSFGEALGLEQNSISEIVARLGEKDFLHVEKRPHETQKHFEKCYYTLLR